MSRKKELISIVVPVFNEEESIHETIRRLEGLKSYFPNHIELEIIYIDDGSTDRSYQLLRESAKSCQTSILKLSRNFGHQIAITAGIENARGDYVAVIDADLQDPPELIVEMYKVALSGYDVVYGQRKIRSGETYFKKITAKLFYRILSSMCDIDIPVDTGDFRLMSRRIVNEFIRMKEKHRFVRGMIPWLGFESKAIYYDRAERFAGETKYPIKKMVEFAFNAILSFSKKPLIVATKLGAAIVLFGVALGVYMLYIKLFTNIPVAGVTSILLTVIIFSGTQIFILGIIGEYIARIFEESKKRPLYVISEIVKTDPNLQYN